MGKINTHRLIKEPFFFITQSFDYAFIDKNFLKGDFGIKDSQLQSGYGKRWNVDISGSMYDKQRDSVSNWQNFLEEKSFKPEQIADFLKLYKEKLKKRKRIQLITSYYVNEEGLFWDGCDLQTFPDRICQKFARLKTDKEKSNFFKKYAFCDFFDAGKVDNGPKETLDHDMQNLVPTESNTTRRLNWLGINRKHETFAEMVTKFQERKTTSKDLEYLEEVIKEDVQEIYLEREVKEIFSNVDPDDERPVYDFLKSFSSGSLSSDSKKLKMIFGHFALCCLELYLEIEKKLPEIKFCANPHCGKQLPLLRHWNQKVCRDNTKCHQQWKALKKREERENKKRRKKIKKTELPKRNLT